VMSVRVMTFSLIRHGPRSMVLCFSFGVQVITRKLFLVIQLRTKLSLEQIYKCLSGVTFL